MLSLFAKRKEAFLESLRHILASVTSDLFVQQMFEDPSSAMFIPDRVIEIVERYLSDDREVYLQELYRAVAAIEAYFGEEDAKDLIDTGKKILDYVTSAHKPVDESYIEKLKRGAKIMSGSASVNKKSLAVLKQFLNDLRNCMELAKKTVMRMMKLIKNAVSFAQTKCRTAMTGVVAQIEEHKSAAQQLKKELEDVQSRFSKHDIPKLRQHFEEQINEHIATEDKLNRQLNKSKKAMLAMTKEHQKVLNELSETQSKLAEARSSLPEMERMKQQNVAYEKQIGAMNEEIKKSQTRIEQLVAASKAKAIEIDNGLQESLAAAKTEIKDKNSQIAELQRVIDKERRGKEEVMNAKSLLEVDVQMAQVKLAMIPSLQKERDEAVEKCEELQQSTMHLQEQIREMSTANEKSQKALEEIREELSTSLNDVQKQTNINKTLNEKVANLTKEMEEKSAQLEKMEKENNKLKKENQDQAVSMQNQEQNIQSVKTKTDELVTELRTKLSSMNNQCDEYASELQAKKQTIMQFKRETKDLAEQLRESEEQRETLEKKLSEALQKLKTTKNSLEQSNDALLYAQDDLRKKESAIKDLQRSEQLSKQQKADLEADLEKAEQTIAQQKAELRENESKLRTMQQDVMEKESEAVKLQTKLQSMNEKALAKKEKRKQMKATIDALQKETKGQKAQIESDQQANENLAHKLASLQKELKMETDRKEAAERAKVSSAEEVTGLHTKMSEDRKRYKEDVAKLQEQVSSLQDTNSEVKRQVDKLLLENKAMARKNDDMKAEDEKKQTQIKALQAQNAHQANEILDLTDDLRKVKDKIRVVTTALPGDSTKLEDIPAIIDGYVKQTKEQAGVLSNLKNLLETDDVVESVGALVKERDQMMKREKNVMKILPKSSTETLAQDVKNMKLSLEKHEEQNKTLLSVVGADNPEKLVGIIADLNKRDQVAAIREAEIKRLLPEYSYDSVPKQIASLQEEATVLKKQARAIAKSIGSQDLIKTVSDMHDRLSCYDKLTDDLVALLPGTDPTGIAQAVKALVNKKEQLEEEEKKILSFKDGDMSKAVDELIAESQELRNVTRVLPKSDESPSAAISKVLSEKEKLEAKWRDIQSFTNSDDPVTTVAEWARTDKALGKILPGEGSHIDKVNDLLRSVDKLQKEQKKIIAALPEGQEAESIVAAVQTTTDKLNALKLEQSKISGLLSNFGGSNFDRVNELLKAKNALAQEQRDMIKLIPAEFKDDSAVDRLSAWKRKYEDMQTERAKIQSYIPSNASISEEVKKMSEQLQELSEEKEQLAKMLNSADIESAVASLLNTKKTFDDVQTIIASQDIVGAAEALVANNNILQRVTEALSCSEPGNLEERANDIQNKLTNVVQSLGLTSEADMSAKVAELREGLQEASRLITQILSLLSNTSKVNIQIPMEASQEKQLLSIIENFRQKAEKALGDVEEILKRGRSLGYNGTVAMESVDFIVQVAVDEEKQHGLERMHQELTSLRTMHEKERSAMDQQKQKLKKKIEEQREIVAQVQEKSAQKEEEYLLEIEKEQRAARFAQNECDREKRIHEELMRVIGGEATDKDFLKCHLGLRELAAITTAEQTLLQQRRM